MPAAYTRLARPCQAGTTIAIATLPRMDSDATVAAAIRTDLGYVRLTFLVTCE